MREQKNLRISLKNKKCKYAVFGPESSPLPSSLSDLKKHDAGNPNKKTKRRRKRMKD